MKFRQKTFLITLFIFLIFLNICCFSLALYFQNKTIRSDEKLCISEYSLIKKAFEKDAFKTNDIGKSLIMTSYGNYYLEKNIYLSLTHNDQVIFSNIPKELKAARNGYASTQRVDNNRFFIITNIIDENYVFTYAKNVDYLDEDFREISIIFVLSSLLASLFLSLILFMVLKKISTPFEELSSATSEIALGNYSVRINPIGKDEIAILAANINSMAQKVEDQIKHLEDNARIKQLMLDNLAHEMKTPLTSIRGYADYISNANINEYERKEASDYIISEADRLESVSEKLLEEALIRENEVIKKEIKIIDILNEMKIIFFQRLIEKNIILSFEDNNIVLYCDPILISIVFSNLIDNAIKASNKNGKIIIECEENTKETKIRIIDNGIGISSEQINHIKEPFYRTDTSRSRSNGGTGLGLSLCDKIIKAHNGELLFSSEINVGTTAMIKFTKP